MTRIDLKEPGSSRVAIERGACHVLYAYDVGFSTDLNRSEELITAQKERAKIRQKRRAPQTFEASPAPLRVTQAAPTMNIAGFETSPLVEAVLYDFGAMCIVYSIPLKCAAGDLQRLSNALYGNEELLEDSRRWCRDMLAAIGPAVTKPSLEPFVEEYVIYQIDALADQTNPVEWIDRDRDQIAQLLRAESAPLSSEEVSDALGCRTSFGRGDLTVIDWNSALVIDPDAEDVRTILEFANVELLELRILDQQLDGFLSKAYEALSKGPRLRFGGLRSHAGVLRRVAQMQADSATMFEGVNNPLKLIGDQYLARLYRAASSRLHLSEWDEGIIRKLQTLDSVYSKMADQQSAWRMEVLEWIIILLIAVSIILPFITTVGGH